MTPTWPQKCLCFTDAPCNPNLHIPLLELHFWIAGLCSHG
ncbi:BnaA10g28520D [Brassica napus]|uniref:BnaA10g28520D protein n=1 Tax=Brassica napus TaxID=3708 RepID=A0A078IVU2_BRANA|nr:BnaA10g28520D [Brassica napus]